MNKLWLPTVLVLALFFVQCGQDSTTTNDSDEPDTSEATDGATDAANNPAKAMEEAMEQLQDMQNGEQVEVVDFRELKALLPESLAGLQRDNVGGEKAGAMGFTVSQAEAEYSDGGDKSLDVTLVDGGGVGMVQMGMAAWAMAEIDREDDNGWARTRTINGHKAYHEHDNDGSGTVSILVAGRGIANVEYRGMSEDEVEKVVKELDVSQMEKLFK